MDPGLLLLALVAVALSFGVSAAAGFGGSIILVPALALVLGTKSGVALAALLLAGNNVVKIVLYRTTLPFRPALAVIVLIALGAAAGARLLVSAPEDVVTVAVIVAFAATFAAERARLHRLLERVGTPVLALASGLTSGFSGTSGPLKGVAVRSLRLDRAHLVGALSLASLAGDATKTTVFAEAGLISTTGYRLAIVAVPLMVAASLVGRKVNRRLGERGFTHLFWGVMICYTGRLVFSV